jgi:hypothetical protein
MTRGWILRGGVALGAGVLALLAVALSGGAESKRELVYENRLKVVAEPKPILADFPEFVEPVREAGRFEAPAVIDEPGADLEVRAWRFSYNARGIIEVPNRLRGAQTAIVVVHPWGIDDGQGWTSPAPAGVAFFCTPAKNRIYHRHVEQVLNPWLKALRGKVGLVAYSLPGREDAIRKKLYRSIRTRPTAQQRRDGARELAQKLENFVYQGEGVSGTLRLDAGEPVEDYFRQFPGLDAGAKYNGEGFWDLPIPVVKGVEVDPEDVVIYDGEGYDPLRDFLKSQGIRNVLLAGYATDMCVCSTTAGYENLSKDFNVFVVGDATLATFPASDTPRFATTAELGRISLKHFVTQVSWVRPATANSE